MLASLDYEVVIAASGREALHAYGTAIPDLLVTDLVMPDMGGRGLTRALRQRPPNLRALLVTSYGVEEALDELEEDGVADVIEKPVAAHTLARVVRRVLEA